jgi:Protein of unknown function (DUF4235)
MKLLYAPIGIVSRLISRPLGRRLFGSVWALIDDAEPPQPDQRLASWPLLLVALLLEGALFRVVTGALDHAARRGFATITGGWPGKDDGDGGTASQR